MVKTRYAHSRATSLTDLSVSNLPASNFCTVVNWSSGKSRINLPVGVNLSGRRLIDPVRD
jgi:hypothetical protein